MTVYHKQDTMPVLRAIPRERGGGDAPVYKRRTEGTVGVIIQKPGREVCQFTEEGWTVVMAILTIIHRNVPVDRRRVDRGNGSDGVWSDILQKRVG